MIDKVSNREFVLTYIRCENVEEIATTLKMSREAVNYRARMLRNNGVNLPKLKRNGVRPRMLEVDELNTVITKFQQKQLS